MICQFMPPAQGGIQILGACAEAHGWLPIAPASTRPGTLDGPESGKLLPGTDQMANQCQEGNTVSQLQSPSRPPLLIFSVAVPRLVVNYQRILNLQTEGRRDPWTQYEPRPAVGS